MAKKTKKDKEVARLRREVEALRAQLKSESMSQRVSASMEKEVVKQPQTEAAPVTIDVRPDLKKTALLTAVCLGILVVLFLTQSRWLP